MDPTIRPPLGIEGQIPESPSVSLLDDGDALVVTLHKGATSVEISDPVMFAWQIEKHAAPSNDGTDEAIERAIEAMYATFALCGVKVNHEPVTRENLNLTQAVAVRNKALAAVASMGKG